MAPFEMDEINFGSGPSDDSFVYDQTSEDYLFGLHSRSVPTDQLSSGVTNSGSYIIDHLSHNIPAALEYPATVIYNEEEAASARHAECSLESLLEFYCPPPEQNCSSLDHSEKSTFYGERQVYGTSSVTTSNVGASRADDHFHETCTALNSDGYFDTGTQVPSMEMLQRSGSIYSQTSPFHDSVQAVSDLTTFTSGGRTMASSSPDDQQDGESAEHLINRSLEDIASWPAPELLFPAIKDHHHFFVSSGAASPSQTMSKAAVSTSNKKRSRTVRSQHVSPKKFRSEIRISKKIICKDQGELLYRSKETKAWLGTYTTLAQKERAHDVGTYFLSTKRNKKFSYPNSESVLAPFKDYVHALPIVTLKKTVIRMAKQYGEHGFLHPGTAWLNR